MSRTRRAVAIGTATVLTTTGLLAAPATALAAAGNDRGHLVSTEHLRTLSAAQTTTALHDGGFGTSAVRYGVDTYRLVYRTVDPQGHPTTASGLLALPTNQVRRLWTVSFTHGTEVYRSDVPSMSSPDDFLTAPAISYAAAGFAAAAPDYLGLGTGPGTHPWMHVPSETTATLDLLRAARAFTPRTGHTLDRQVLATGFSQGASAALGLGRALQSGTDPWFRLTALAPISGAYDFRHAAIPSMLDGQVSGRIAVVYTSYLLVAWNRLHHLYATPAEVFRPPYAARVDKLFDGTTSGQDMLAGLPDTLDQLLTAHGLDLLRHPAPRFAAALRVADSVCAWSPPVPVRLYQAAGDEQAVNANTAHCHAALAARHVDAPVTDLGTPDYHGSRHLGSGVAGTDAIVAWFRHLHSA